MYVADECIQVPCYVVRGAGKTTHYEYEVRIDLNEDRWVLLRRFRRFRDLYLNMKAVYGPKASTFIYFFLVGS